MSALRQLLGALRAALLVRGRLLALRLRRLFGGGPKQDAGPDFHLTAADTPVEGVDYLPTELPVELTARLQATRAELVDHARARTERQPSPGGRRRLRTASVAVAALLGLGAVGAGASAVVTGSTGVPAVDRLLGIYEQGLDKPGAADRSGPSGSDVQPGPSKASEPIETTQPDGARSVATFYVAKDGRICWAVASLDGSGSGTLSCDAPSDVVSGMRDGGYVPGSGFAASAIVLVGYVRGDVVSLSGHGPNGSLEVQLGKPWTPSSIPAVGVLKPFVAIAPFDSPSALDAPDGQPALRLRSYTFDAVTEDGGQVRFSP